jgi:hypothetical protein
MNTSSLVGDIQVPSAIRDYAKSNKRIHLVGDMLDTEKTGVLPHLRELAVGELILIHFKGHQMSCKDGGTALTEFVSLDTSGTVPTLRCTKLAGMVKVCPCSTFNLECVIAFVSIPTQLTKRTVFFSRDPKGLLFIETAKNFAP